MLMLLRDPQLANRLRGDRTVVSPFLDELFRLESSVGPGPPPNGD
jgi:hypothetical protein